MSRNFTAERKRIRAEYEERIADCRAQMDKSWEAKRKKYVPTTDDPLEDIRVRGLRFDALFEEVTARNQRIEGFRHEMECKLRKVGELIASGGILTTDLAQYRAEGDVVIVDVPTAGHDDWRSHPISPVSPSTERARERLFTPDESVDEDQLLTPPTSAVTRVAASAATPAVLAPAQPGPGNDSVPQEQGTQRSTHRIKFLSVLPLMIMRREAAAMETPAGNSPL